MSGTLSNKAGSKATRREWIGLGVIALPCMLYSMDLTVLNLAVPALSADLRPTASELLWIIDIYGFMVAGFLMTMGTLGDRIGRRKLLMWGAAAFGVASVLAAFANSAAMLISARTVLGIAGATLAPSTLSLISNMFRDPAERTFAIGMWIASFSAGAVIGPVVGGILIRYFWWGSVFLVAVPVMALLLVLGPLLLPEYKSPAAQRIDAASAGLSLVAVLTIIYGTKHWAEYQLDGQALAALALGLAVGFIFVRRQATLAEPFIDLRLFRIPRFSVSVMLNLLGMFFMVGGFVFIAQYLQLVAGLTPLMAGLWSVPAAVAFTVMSMVTPALVARVNARDVMAAGMTTSAVGFVMLAAAGSLFEVVAATMVFSVGFTPVVTLTTNFIVSAVPPEKSGTASAISETAFELGGALGIALLGSLMTLIYRSQMAGALPAALSEEAAAAARSTLAGAVAAAPRLPAEVQLPFVMLAREAFLAGLQAVALVAASGMIAAVFLTIRVLKPEAQKEF